MHQFKKDNGRKNVLVISGEKQLMSSYKRKMETLPFTEQLEKNPHLQQRNYSITCWTSTSRIA
jgi:hypothetical protein